MWYRFTTSVTLEVCQSSHSQCIGYTGRSLTRKGSCGNQGQAEDTIRSLQVSRTQMLLLSSLFRLPSTICIPRCQYVSSSSTRPHQFWKPTGPQISAVIGKPSECLSRESMQGTILMSTSPDKILLKVGWPIISWSTTRISNCKVLGSMGRSSMMAPTTSPVVFKQLCSSAKCVTEGRCCSPDDLSNFQLAVTISKCVTEAKILLVKSMGCATDMRNVIHRREGKERSWIWGGRRRSHKAKEVRLGHAQTKSAKSVRTACLVEKVRT